MVDIQNEGFEILGAQEIFARKLASIFDVGRRERAACTRSSLKVSLMYSNYEALFDGAPEKSPVV